MRPSYSRLRAHQSKKFVTNKHLKKYLSLLIFALSIFLFFLCLSKLTYVKALTIQNVTVSGTRDEISNLVKEQVGTMLKGAYLGIFAKTNAFLYPHDKLVASIQASAPQIKSLTVNRNGLSGLRIDIVEKNPVAKICPFLPEFDDDHNLKIYNNCYYSDWSGQIFDLADGATTTTENIYFVPSLAENASSSQSLLLGFATSTQEFINLQNFYDGARRADLKPTFVLLKADGEYEMYANDVIIYFNSLRPLDEQLVNLVSFWKHESNKKYINNRESGFEYIDVRYGSNVFYRLIQ
jgi:hypothetical protein